VQLLDTPVAKLGVLEDLLSYGYIVGPADSKNSRPRVFVSAKSFEGHGSVYMLQYEPQSQFELSFAIGKTYSLSIMNRVAQRSVTKVGGLLASAAFTNSFAAMHAAHGDRGSKCWPAVLERESIAWAERRRWVMEGKGR